MTKILIKRDAFKVIRIKFLILAAYVRPKLESEAMHKSLAFLMYRIPVALHLFFSGIYKTILT